MQNLKNDLKNYIAKHSISSENMRTITDLENFFDEDYKKERQKMTFHDIVAEMVGNVLDHFSIDDESLKQYKAENNDFWNGKTVNGGYWCDLVSEWADAQVDIYHSDLWEKAKTFQSETEDAIDEFGYNKERGLTGIFSQGQYLFYSNFANEVLNGIKDFVESEIDDEDQN